jgi:hypothetical protein
MFRRIFMDTEAIAHEIVRIRTRLDEMNGEVEGARDGDVDDERAVLEERLRYLQDELAAPSGDPSEDHLSSGVDYVPPA